MSILNNAIESIQVGVEDYLMSDSKRYLSSVRNICAGILLLYKEKLRLLSPPHDPEILIKKDIKPSYDNNGNVVFIGSGKKTVDVQSIEDRFKDLSITVDWKKFKELIELRNNIEHYYTDKTTDAVREIIAKSFILIRDFIVDQLEEEPASLLGDECWQSLLTVSDVYNKEEQDCKMSLSNIDWKYITLKDSTKNIRCPHCHSGLIKTDEEGEYSSSTGLWCISCRAMFAFSDVVEQCLSDSLASAIYIARKDGGESPLEVCPACLKDSYMVVEEHCAICDYEQEYLECEMCGATLSLDEQILDGCCNYCNYQLEKLMTE
jgi:hypothetical protein